MLMAFHIFFYFVFVAVILIYFLVSFITGWQKQYRRSIHIGLLLSPLGLVIPYFLFMFIVLACHHSWPFDGIPIIDPIARVVVPSILVLGPCIGPPLIFFFAVRFIKKNDSA